MARRKFSNQLEDWLQQPGKKTVGDLDDVFGEKGFAILFLLFMFIPSLPIPTGGITHFVLLPVVWIASLEMIFGRRTLWFPWFITRIELGKSLLEKGLPFMMRRIRWIEKRSRPRLSHYFEAAAFRSFAGLCVFLLAVAAFVSPPFSGLDTLPSLGAVIIALSLILEDAMLFLAGLAVGVGGIGVMVIFANAIILFFRHVF